MSIPVVVVAGPTASGKSALALDIALAFDGVVINADSMQVYRELAILSARPTAAELAQVPHRLYGIVPASERFSAGAWRRSAVETLEAVADGRQLPVFCGGTGLYLKALTEGIAPIPEISEAVRRASRDLYDHIGGEAFLARLTERDPQTAKRLQPSDRQRLCRAWDVLEATGRPLASWQAAPIEGAPDATFCTILLSPPREALYAACDARFDAMIADGAIEEVAALVGADLDPGLPAMKALGIKDLRRFLAGEIDIGSAMSAAKRATRNFAKRQETWFRHQMKADLIVNEQYSESLRPEIFSFIRDFMLTTVA